MANEKGPNLEQKQRIGLFLSENDICAIDDWGFGQRIRNRSDAIKELIYAGLRASKGTTTEQKV